MERQVTPVGKRNKLGLTCQFVSMWDSVMESGTWCVMAEEITLDGRIELAVHMFIPYEQALTKYDELIRKYNTHYHKCEVCEIKLECYYDKECFAIEGPIVCIEHELPVRS